MRRRENHRRTIGEWRKKNPDKQSTYRNNWEKFNPEKHKESCYMTHIRKTYGKNAKEIYILLVNKQNNVCAICGGTSIRKRLAIDHCHKSGEIRGLLCSHCNTGLGMFRDSKEFLLNAIRYLESKERAITSLSVIKQEGVNHGSGTEEASVECARN